MSRPVDLTGENSYHANHNSNQGLLGLPKEIQELVFRYLGLKDLCAVERTCRQLRASVVDYQSIAFWTTQFKKHFGKPLSGDPELMMTKSLYGPFYHFFNKYYQSRLPHVMTGKFFSDYNLIDPTVRRYPNFQIKVYKTSIMRIPWPYHDEQPTDTDPSLETDVQFLKHNQYYLWLTGGHQMMPLREQTRIEMAMDLLSEEPTNLPPIKDYGITHQASLIKMAQIIARYNCEALEKQLQTFGIQDKTILAEFNRIIKIHQDAKPALDQPHD